MILVEINDLSYELCKIRNLVENPLMKERISYQVWLINNNGIIIPGNEMGKYALPITMILEDLQQIEKIGTSFVANLSRKLQEGIKEEGIGEFTLETLKNYETRVQRKHFYPGIDEEKLKKVPRKI